MIIVLKERERERSSFGGIGRGALWSLCLGALNAALTISRSFIYNYLTCTRPFVWLRKCVYVPCSNFWCFFFHILIFNVYYVLMVILQCNGGIICQKRAFKEFEFTQFSIWAKLRKILLSTGGSRSPKFAGARDLCLSSFCRGKGVEYLTYYSKIPLHW